MDYAYDAAKILRDWPEEVKHLYSLLPKRMTRNLTKKLPQNLPKKQIIQRINRVEVPLIEIHLELCAQPSIALISKNDDDIVQKQKSPVNEIVVPVPRRRRIVKTKAKERIADNRSDKTPLKSETPSVQHPREKAVPILSSTPDNIEPYNPFTSLNDDCLISLFQFCDKLDLVSVALVCERFRFIVFNYLRAKISKIVDLGIIKSYDKLTICEATKFLKFIDAAQNTQQLEITMSSFHEFKDDVILEEILKCCGSNLRCIKFNGFNFPEKFANQWKHILRALTSLTFHQCILQSNHFNNLLKLCENLEVLNVTNSNSNGLDTDDNIKCEFSLFKCTKLKEFRLASSRHCGNSSELIWLLENNLNLSVLRMSDIGDSVKLTGDILQCVGRFQQLQDLAFSFQNFDCNLSSNLHHLMRLKELKSLSLQCDWVNISTFVRQFSQAANKQIESLTFECVDIDISFMRSIGRFRRLKYLKLENTVVNEPSQEVFEQSLMDLTYRLNNLSRFHCQLHLFTEDSLVQFVERMKKLEHFQISGLVMNLLLFMRMVTACGRRINGIKLNIVIDNYQHLNEYLDLVSGKPFVKFEIVFFVLNFR